MIDLFAADEICIIFSFRPQLNFNIRTKEL